MSFDKKNIRVLHIEPTTVCQAACPQCARENHDYYIDEFNRSDLTLEQCQSIVGDMVDQLDKMFMCGNFGDPAAGKDTLDIFRWFRARNPEITLGMNSNGGLRTPEWWRSLAKIMSQSGDYVVFSIDGLEDTNHIYRRNVDWNKLMENVSAFIDAGGHAHWDMLVFEHNQHQVGRAEQLARDLGFKWFRQKVSKRFKTTPVFWLHPPAGHDLPNVENPESIDCHALREKSLYLAATGEIFPCCWLGNNVFVRDGHLDRLMATENFQGITQSWLSNPHPVCSTTCGSKHGTTSFKSQWQKEINLQ